MDGKNLILSTTLLVFLRPIYYHVITNFNINCFYKKHVKQIILKHSLLKHADADHMNVEYLPY